MPFYGDLGLGFPSSLLVFFVFLSSPFLLVFLISRKWRISEARKQEVRRLAYLASVEAERAELEARVSYGFTVSDPRPQCAVCYCPTTTRCARCKAVHYCSGKCQIIHWRQGHKEECHPPPSTVVQSNDTESDSGSKAVSQVEQSDLYDSSLETDRKLHAQPIEAFLERPTSSNGFLFSGDFGGNSDVEVKPFVDDTGTDFITVSPSFLSSTGCSTSSVPAEQLINVSASEASVSSTPARSEGPSSDEISPSILRATADINETNPTKSSPSVNSNFSSKLKQKTPSCNAGVIDCQSSNSSASSLNGSDENTISKPSPAPVHFREARLDPRVSLNANHDPSTQPSFDNGDHDAQTNSGFQFSFNLSGQAVPSLSPPSDQKPLVSDDVHQRLPGNEMPVYEAASLRKSVTDVCVKKSSDSLDFKGSNDAGLVKSRGTTSSSFGASADHPSSSCGGDTVSSTKCSKVDSPCTVPTLYEAVSSAPNVSNGLKTSMRKVVQQFKATKLSKHYPLGYGNEIAGKENYKVLFPYDLFIKLYNSNKVELRPCGLTNCGNSCYANAVLQCLAFTRPLTAYLLQGLHTKTCPKKEWCFTCEFESLVLNARQGKSPLSPIGILSQIQSIGSHLGHGKEEDAHEFLRYAIDTMQSVCLKEASPSAVGQFSEETTLIKLIFGGYLRSRIKCMKCQGKSERQERMMDLTVEIQGDIGTLEEALTQFTATEILDGDNKYQCNRCKSYERAKKKLTVLEAPNVLTIALKRFQSGKFGKLNKSVRFPEILDLAPFMSGTSDKSPIYNLYAVVVHLDIMNAAFSGHYVCYVKNIQGKWYKIDDSTVKPVELERVLSKGAYMLLYSRCSPRAPSLIRKMMSQDYVKSKSRRCTDSVPSNHGERGIPLKATSNSSGAFRRPEGYPYWATPEGPTSFESFDSFDGRFFPGYRIPKVESSSDNSSLFSCSDEGSCSTESTRDSISTDEYSEYFFGDSGRVSWNSPLRVLENDSPEVCYPSSEFASSNRREVLGGRESPTPLYFDKNEQCRKLADCNSRSETDVVSGFVNPSGLTLRRCKERTQTFY